MFFTYFCRLPIDHFEFMTLIGSKFSLAETDLSLRNFSFQKFALIPA